MRQECTLSASPPPHPHPPNALQMMSVRDALYDVMFDDANPYKVNRSEVLVDIVHGALAGWGGVGLGWGGGL